MGKIKRICFISLLLMLGGQVFAYQISFQVIQHDNVNQKVTEKSLTVEDNLFTGFFNKGYIVTNSQAVISKSVDQDDNLWSKGFGEAYDGFSDYFVQVKLYYSDPVKNPDNGKMIQNINKVDYMITKVLSGETIYEKVIDYDENDSDVSVVSSDLIININKVIKAKA